MLSQLRVSLIAMLATVAGLALTSTAANAVTPVSFVFVSSGNPNTVQSLAVSANGSFTHVSSVSSPTTIYHLSVSKKFLFGIDDSANIYTYSIASNGALALVATTNAGKDIDNYAIASTVLQLDETASTLYTIQGASATDWYLASFKIESNGELQFLGTSYADPNALTQIRFVQNGLYAVTTGCYNTAPGASFTTDSNDVNDIAEYKRETNGFLTYIGISHDAPTANSPYEYCAGQSASDSTDHLAVGYTVFNPPGDDLEGYYTLGTYTVNAEGAPSTTSTYENMPTTSVLPDAISIDPTGKLLAIGGNEYYQFFHYNGANPITSYSPAIAENDQVRELGWDTSGHFFLLSGHSVEAYDITPASYKEIKPWEVFDPYSLIVLSL